MAQTVTLKNGEVHTFPDEASPEDIDMALKQYQTNSQPSMLSKIAGGAEQSVLGFGDALRNTLLSAGQLAGSGLMPQSLMQQIRQPTGEGTAYNVGNVAGDIGTFLGGGELLDATRAATEGPGLVGKIAEYLGKPGIVPGAIKRALPSAAYGAAEKPDQAGLGAAEGAGLSLAGEALPLALTGIGKFAEKAFPIKSIENQVKNIHNYYQDAKQRFTDIRDVTNRVFKNKSISKNKYDNLAQDKIDKYFDSDLEDLHNAYIKNPTWENADDLQSAMGNYMGDLMRNPKGRETNKNINWIKSTRDNLKDDMFQSMNKQNPTLANAYKESNDIYSNEVIPLQGSEKLHGIGEGNVSDVTASELRNAVKKAMENRQTYRKLKNQPEHFLNKTYDSIKDIKHGSSLAKNISSILGGGALGYAMGGDPMSALLGGAIGKTLGPTAIDLAQNPKVTNTISKMAPYYDLLRKALIGANLGNF